MSNDDNYYVPGYLEQMIFAAENADLVMCYLLHSYFAWSAVTEGNDIGGWLARAKLIRQVPWKGAEFTTDREYLGAIKALAGDRVAMVKKILFVHN